jgi:signal peptidase II
MGAGRKNIPYFILLAGLVAADQATKALIAARLRLFESLPVIPGLLNLSRVHNRGAIFGFLNQSPHAWVRAVLIGLSLAALVLVVVTFFKTPASQKGLRMALTLILAGAVGNQIDRLLRGYVIDFIDVHVKSFVWPTFNVADSCISIGAVLLLAFVVFRRSS